MRVVISEFNVYKVLSVLNLNNILGNTLNIIEILINKSIESLIYLTTNDSVVQVDIFNLTDSICKSHLFCSECHQDPLCIWKKSECVPNLNNEQKQSCFDLEIFERNSKMNFSLSVLTGESFVIECFMDYNGRFDINKYLLLNQVKWYRDGVELISENWRLGSQGELILFKIQNKDSGVFTCKFDTYLMSIVSLYVNDNIITTASDSTEDQIREKLNNSMNSINEIVEEWKMEIEQYKIKMDEYDKYLNCSINCDC